MLRALPDIHGIHQYGIGVLVIEDKEVLGDAAGCGGEAICDICGDPP